MSFTDTEKHWLWGCAAATAASRSDVNVALPHLRGKWSPTNAILRILEPSSMRQSLPSSRSALLCTRVCAPTANVRNLHYRALKTTWQGHGKDMRAHESSSRSEL